MTIFSKSVSNMLFYSIMMILIVVILVLLPYLKNESEVAMSIEQISPAVSEKALYSGDELSIVFNCDSMSVDRWIVNLTTTANLDNAGYIILKIDGVGEKKLRTSLFNKISGTYSIPIYHKMILDQPKKIVLHVTLKGGNKKEPLIYIAEKAEGDAVIYQITLQPEKGYPVILPKNTFYPRSLFKYKQSGACIPVIN